jgi:hypothetical protein
MQVWDWNGSAKRILSRPNAIVHARNDNNNNQKTVAFQDQVDNWGDNHAGSFGDDDDNDGPGFEYMTIGDDDDDFVVTKLDDVRKVDKAILMLVMRLSPRR